MVSNSVTSPIIIRPFKKHLQLKNSLITLIDASQGTALNDRNDRISKTDWNLDPAIKRPYLEILTPHLLEHLKDAYESIGMMGFQIHNFWYQQYHQNSTHDWHGHQAAQYTNIYYIELPHGAPKTQILNPMNLKEVIELDVKEGDIVSFPAHVFHRSPPVESSLRKTILSFNTSFLEMLPK